MESLHPNESTALMEEEEELLRCVGDEGDSSEVCPHPRWFGVHSVFFAGVDPRERLEFIRWR